MAALFLNHISNYDWLIALEFGRVDEGQPPGSWRGVDASFGYLHDGPGGRALGFKVLGFSEFDPEDEEVAEIWTGPRFDVPALGLIDASAGEIVLATRAHFGEDELSVNRVFFEQAVNASGEQAVDLWRCCIESGDCMGHSGLGYTLHELGRFAEAYRHLRYYAEISPHNKWAWRWRGVAAQSIGELGEARTAFHRTLELDDEGETDAEELLAALSS